VYEVGEIYMLREIMTKPKQWIFSEILFHPNQVINLYSTEVKSRHVQFGDPSSLGRGCNSKCFYGFPIGNV